jgi:hypothetical protein
MKKPPSPPCLPLIGHIPGFRRDVLGLIKRSVREYGDMIYFKLGPYPIYLINHPDSIVHVLKKMPRTTTRKPAASRSLWQLKVLQWSGTAAHGTW